MDSEGAATLVMAVISSSVPYGFYSMLLGARTLSLLVAGEGLGHREAAARIRGVLSWQGCTGCTSDGNSGSC